jgi:hypothetical protein
MAGEMGAVVVQLDMKIPFTAARARNEGFRRLMELAPDLLYVQFVDGDCEVVETWSKNAVGFLDEHENVAVVCGRRRERNPESSVYNLLCDWEWDTPLGEAKACGGDAMMRVDAFNAVGGYRPDLIAGEEPELCVRLRTKGWKIWRIDKEMVLHDAAMTRFGQWWKRAMRAGYAFAEGAYIHGAPPERHWVKESRRAWLWGVGIPLTALILACFIGWPGVLILLIYPAQVVRLSMTAKGRMKKHRWLFGFYVLGKFPEAMGQFKFLQHRFFGGQGRIIEYK